MDSLRPLDNSLISPFDAEITESDYLTNPPTFFEVNMVMHACTYSGGVVPVVRWCSGAVVQEKQRKNKGTCLYCA